MNIPPPVEPLDDREMRWYVALWASLADPPAVTAGQIVTGLLKAAVGVLFLVYQPGYMLEVAGGIPAVFIGAVLVLGGLVASWSAWRLHPALEEVGLRTAQVGLVGLFTVFAFIIWGADGRPFLISVLALLVGMALFDAEKRIRRLRWDQVHPFRGV